MPARDEARTGMTFTYPWMLLVAALVVAALAVAYRALDQSRARALAAIDVRSAGLSRRRHIPPLVFLIGLAVLLVGLGRPQATVQVPRVSGTIVLAFDVSNSMMATDVTPSRLGAAREAAVAFVRAQPETVDVGVVAFDQGAITAKEPTNDREAVVTTIERLRPAGATSLGQAILTSLSAIVGEPVYLPDPDSGEPAPDLGYWGSAMIVLFSDGEDTGGPDAIAAAEIAASAGVRVQTVGIGTIEGATIEVDGFQVATALNDELLTAVARATAGDYHHATDVASISDVYKDIELRITSRPQLLELTGAAALLAVALLTAGAALMTLWYGRII
jgi:Ca-activated chloride channel family protein